MSKLSHEKLKELAALCVGAALLVAVALVLSGRGPFVSPSLKLALQQKAPSQSAAAWESQYPDVDGWPLSHWPTSGAKQNSSDLSYLGSWCNEGYPSANPNRCPLPSYFDIYVNNNPSQKMTAEVIQPGYYFNFLSYEGPYYTGSISTVPAGTSLTIEWSCQDWQGFEYSYSGSCNNYDAFGNCIGYNSGSSGTEYYYFYNNAFINGTAYPTVGDTTVTPTQTTTYNLYCKSAGSASSSGNKFPDTPTLSFTVPVSGPPLPTETIVSDAPSVNGVPTIYNGQSTTITATYTAGAGDTLTQTAIDGPNNTNSVPGVPWTPPTSPKSYVFTPTALGTYTFYPSLQSTAYPSWNNYSASTTVTVVNECPNGQGVAGSCTSCDSGYTLTGIAPNNSCVVSDTCTDITAVPTPPIPAGCQTPSPSPGACIPPGDAYNSSSNSCAPVVSTITSFSASPTLVHKAVPTSVTFSWNVANPPASCTISGPSGFTPLSISPQGGVAGHQAATVTLSQASFFTLTCGSVTSQITLGLIPAVQEL